MRRWNWPDRDSSGGMGGVSTERIRIQKMNIPTTTAAIRPLRLKAGSRRDRKAGVRNASANCGGLASVVATTMKANTANSPVLAGRSLVRAREAIATARIDRLISNASCEAELNCERVIGRSSVAKVSALPRLQI